MLGHRLYYHFYLNNYHDPSRETFVIERFPFNISEIVDVPALIKAHSEVPGWEKTARAFFMGITDGNNIYAPFIKELQPSKYEMIMSPRATIADLVSDYVVKEKGIKLYPVDVDSAWSVFSISSTPSRNEGFAYHYDAESANEYRALFVVSGGDDCGEPSVHYLDANHTQQSISIPTGFGYMIRGSQTFHAVNGGGCGNSTRVLYGMQFSTKPNNKAVSLCTYLLMAQAMIRNQVEKVVQML